MALDKRDDEAQLDPELMPRVRSEIRGILVPSSAPRGGRPAPQAGLSSPKLLTVGPGISLTGEIAACDYLVIEGSAQVTLKDVRMIEITESGRFTNGRAEVENAVIAGVYEGELLVRGRLVIRSTGRVSGRAQYGEVEVERGGQLVGSVKFLAGSSAAPRSSAEPAPEPTTDESVPTEDGRPVPPPVAAGAGARPQLDREDHELLRR
jgi:cytoskeletal protein CcmA (bactofilin family)